jgi:hypothetical protein
MMLPESRDIAFAFFSKLPASTAAAVYQERRRECRGTKRYQFTNEFRGQWTVTPTRICLNAGHLVRYEGVLLQICNN